MQSACPRTNQGDDGHVLRAAKSGIARHARPVAQRESSRHAQITLSYSAQERGVQSFCGCSSLFAPVRPMEGLPPSALADRRHYRQSQPSCWCRRRPPLVILVVWVFLVFFGQYLFHRVLVTRASWSEASPGPGKAGHGAIARRARRQRGAIDMNE